MGSTPTSPTTGENSRALYLTVLAFLFPSGSQTYDVIFSDVYFSLYSIPSHFATREFFHIVRDRLNLRGILIVNLIGTLAPTRPSLTYSFIKKFRSMFPARYVFAAESPTTRGTQNLILVGVNGTMLPPLDSPTVAENPNPLIRSLPGRRVPVEQVDFSLFWDLADDYAPVEYPGPHSLPFG